MSKNKERVKLIWLKFRNLTSSSNTSEFLASDFVTLSNILLQITQLNSMSKNKERVKLIWLKFRNLTSSSNTSEFLASDFVTLSNILLQITLADIRSIKNKLSLTSSWRNSEVNIRSPQRNEVKKMQRVWAELAEWVLHF